MKITRYQSIDEQRAEDESFDRVIASIKVKETTKQAIALHFAKQYWETDHNHTPKTYWTTHCFKLVSFQVVENLYIPIELRRYQYVRKYYAGEPTQPIMIDKTRLAIKAIKQLYYDKIRQWEQADYFETVSPLHILQILNFCTTYNS